MSKFTIRNLPTGCVYLIPAPRMRPFLQQYEDNFESVMYSGLSYSEQNLSKWQEKMNPRSVSLGVLECHEDSSIDQWKFNLELYGVREFHLPSDPRDLAMAMMNDLVLNVNKILDLPETASRTIKNLYLGYSIDMDTGVAEYRSFRPRS